MTESYSATQRAGFVFKKSQNKVTSFSEKFYYCEKKKLLDDIGTKPEILD